LIWQNLATGRVVIWYMDGADIGSAEVLVSSMADYRIVAVGDLDGDGLMDLVWQRINGANTELVAWYLNEAGVIKANGAKLLGSVPGGYRCVGLGDYNSDGILDILWQQVDTQQIIAWHMNTAGVRTGFQVLNVGGEGQYVAHWQWEFSAGAVHNDENGDGRADILWQHSSTGQVVSWRMNGAWARDTFATLANSAASTERVVAQADFNGDGINDLLWSVKSGGQTRAIVWYRNAAGARTSYAVLGSVPEVYELVGAGDMNRDGNTDLLWQHSTTGQLVAWHYNGAGVRLSHAVIVSSMSGYRVHAVGDMNGDDNADLIWQGVSASNATTIIWYMNGAGARSSFRTLASLPSAWTLGTVGDYNGDGHMDVVWKNNSTGQIVGWALNATQQRISHHTIATGMAAWRVGAR
jgi:hypothetical protein